MNCFDKIKSNIVRNVNSWNNNRKEKAYVALNGGKAILKNQDELDCYIFAFGNMHKAKLICAFQTINDLKEINNKKISIIDYGCGQGIGSIVLIDYLKSLTLDFLISDVKLIEPSEIALQAAKEYLSDCINIDNIESINSDLNRIEPDILKTNDKGVTFHIFSNILDVEEVDIENIFKNMIESITGVNYIVCVSPDYWSGNEKLDEFIQYFRDNLPDKEFTIISERQGTIDNPSNPNSPWKAYEKVFKVVV
jgi:hypothetical protein